MEARDIVMSRHERRYQKYLERKRQKHGTTSDTARLAGQIATLSHYPVHEALVSKKLFEVGMGHLLFSRALPEGRIALGAFLLDVYCRGVKDALVSVLSKGEYGVQRNKWSSSEGLEPMEPACFRKLLEGGVAYARNLGFNPHEDYAAARQLLGDVLATDCPKQFTYGRDGKPFFVSSPTDTPEQIDAIVAQLEERLGPGNFDYLIVDESF
jgi:hypothetical protein